MCMGVLSICVPHSCLDPADARRRHGVTGYGESPSELGNKLRSSARAVCILTVEPSFQPVLKKCRFFKIYLFSVCMHVYMHMCVQV